MNIGLFTDTYFPQINGVVTSTRMLAEELQALGHFVHIFTTTDPKAEKKEPHIYRLPSRPLRFLPTHRMALFFPPTLVAKIRSMKLDVIHTQSEFPLGFFGKFVSRLYRIPLVHTYHTMYEDYVHYVDKNGFFTKDTAKRFSRFFCNGAYAVITPTVKTRDYLLSVGVQRPMHVIPTGIDLKRFGRSNFTQGDIDATRAQYNIQTGDTVIVTVGRLAKEKSVDVLVAMMPDLLKLMPNVKLMIVGDGPVRGELQQQAAALGVVGSVIFTGNQLWDTIGKFYLIADLFMTASTSESQGLTHIEAMAAGLPVLVKDDPCFCELIVNGVTGFVYGKDGDAAQAAYHVLTHPDLADEVAKNGWDAIQPLSSRQFALAVEEVYRSVAENRRKRKALRILRPRRKPL